MAATAMIVGAVVGAVAAIGSGVMSYMQAQSQAAAQRSQAAYAQQMGLRNQQIMEIAAGQAREKGQYEADLLRERQRKMLGKQLALYGASGVDIYGSPLEVMGQTWSEYDRDAQAAIKNANYEAWKYETSGQTSLIESSAAAERYNQEANITETKGTSALIAAPIVAGSSILTAYGNYDLAQTYGYRPRF